MVPQPVRIFHLRLFFPRSLSFASSLSRGVGASLALKRGELYPRGDERVDCLKTPCDPRSELAGVEVRRRPATAAKVRTKPARTSFTHEVRQEMRDGRRHRKERKI